MTVPSATSRTNEAAERLRKRIRDERDQLNPLTALGDLDRALSEERRLTVERIRSIHQKQEGLRRLHPVTRTITDYICEECDRPWPCNTVRILDEIGGAR